MSRSVEARLAARYGRVAGQLGELFAKTADPMARMATVAALLHGKMPHFFWTGFYRLVDGAGGAGDLVVGPYQGPLACAVLARRRGVCWAVVERGETVLVPDVQRFPGHIACDSRSRSEVAVPVRARDGRLVAVLDVDSEELDAFSETDARGLEAVAAMIWGPG